MNEFNQVSKTFSSRYQMEKEKQFLIDSLCKFYNLDRKKFRLQQGLITLQGYYNDSWINLTNKITNYNHYLNNPSYYEYRLSIKAQIKGVK